MPMGSFVKNVEKKSIEVKFSSLLLFQEHMGSGEMFPLLRPLTALLKDPGSISSVHNWLTSFCICSSRSSYRVFWTPQTTGMHMVHRLT